MRTWWGCFSWWNDMNMFIWLHIYIHTHLVCSSVHLNHIVSFSHIEHGIFHDLEAFPDHLRFCPDGAELLWWHLYVWPRGWKLGGSGGLFVWPWLICWVFPQVVTRNDHKLGQKLYYALNMTNLECFQSKTMVCPKHDQSGVFPDYRMAMTGRKSTNNLHTSAHLIEKVEKICNNNGANSDNDKYWQWYATIKRWSSQPLVNFSSKQE